VRRYTIGWASSWSYFPLGLVSVLSIVSLSFVYILLFIFDLLYKRQVSSLPCISLVVCCFICYKFDGRKFQGGFGGMMHSTFCLYK
jgi:hypothetical protein